MSIQVVNFHQTTTLMPIEPLISSKGKSNSSEKSELTKALFFDLILLFNKLKQKSNYEILFAKKTWTCKCGFKNYTDIWKCAVCGKPRPSR